MLNVNSSLALKHETFCNQVFTKLVNETGLNLPLVCLCCWCVLLCTSPCWNTDSITSLSFRSLWSPEIYSSVWTGRQKMFTQWPYFILMIQWQLKQQDRALIATVTRAAAGSGSTDLKNLVFHFTKAKHLLVQDFQELQCISRGKY